MPSTTVVSAKRLNWKRILRFIPGYDPYADSKGCHFDEDAAQLACDFFPTYLVHIEGQLAGQPFELEAWQRAIVANLFGWKRKSDGLRRYRTAFVLVPRKNGKSTLAAGVALYTLFVDRENGSQIYSCAADRNQAHLVFDPASKMVHRNPDLDEMAVVYRTSIVLKDGSGSYKTISSDVKSKWGFNTHCAIIDEVHAHQNRELIDALVTSTGARTQPIEFYITTVDYERESICNEKHDYALKVRDGVITNQAFLPVIYETAKDADWHDEKVWKAANPGWGGAVNVDIFRQDYELARQTPAFENVFKRFRLNMRTEQAVAWIPLDKWDACGEPFDIETLAGQECYAGLDLASTTDMAAFVLFFPKAGNAILPFYWVPRESAHVRSDRDGVPYDAWIRDGFLNATEGNMIDQDVIRQAINELGQRYKIIEIALDRWNSAQLMTQLQGDGFTIVPFGQGFKSLSGPTKHLEGLIAQGSLRQGGHPILRWNATNVVLETDAADNWKPSKKKSSDKIDGLVALIMGIGQWLIAEKPRESVYEKRGVLWL